jgi:hypothetical protein
VLVSIQSLILVDDPYFNEPGYQVRQTSSLNEAFRTLLLVDQVHESLLHRHFARTEGPQHAWGDAEEQGLQRQHPTRHLTIRGAGAAAAVRWVKADPRGCVSYVVSQPHLRTFTPPPQRERERVGHTQTQTHRHRHADTQTQTQTDRQKHTHTTNTQQTRASALQPHTARRRSSRTSSRSTSPSAARSCWPSATPGCARFVGCRKESGAIRGLAIGAGSVVLRHQQICSSFCILAVRYAEHRHHGGRH